MSNLEGGFQENEVTQEQSGDILESLKSELIAKIEDPQLESIALQKAEKLDKNSDQFVEQSKDLLKAFQNVEKSILKVEQPGKELFMSFLETSLNADMLLQIIADNRGRKLKKYTKKNGYVINDATLDFFNKSLGSDKYSIQKKEENKVEAKEEEIEQIENKVEAKKEEIEQIKNKEEGQTTVEKEKFTNDKYKEAIKELNEKDFEVKGLSGNVSEIINGIKNGENTPHDLLTHFNNNPKEFKKFLTILHKNGNGSFEKITKLIQNEKGEGGKLKWGGLIAEIKHFNTEINTKKEVEKSSTTELTQRAIHEAVIGRHQDIDGQNVEFDESEVPPIRTLSLEGGNFSYKSEMGISVFYEAMVRYEETKQDLDRSTGQLREEYGSLKSKSEGNKSDIEDKKDEIDLMKSLGNPTDDLEKELSLLIDNTIVIEQALELKREEINLINNELKGLNLEYAMDLDSLIDRYERDLETQDQISKSKLQILQNMTQGAVDQTPLENIFTEMNDSSLQIDIGKGMIVSGFDLDTFEISGSGIPQGLHEDINNKKNDEIIARMMNVMFSGSPERPIDLETIYTGLPVFKDEEGDNISSTFGNKMRSELGIDPRNTMRKNIEKHNSGEGEDQTIKE